jgi:hypothetical protein
VDPLAGDRRHTGASQKTSIVERTESVIVRAEACCSQSVATSAVETIEP